MPRGEYGSWEQLEDRVRKWGKLAVAIDDAIIPDRDDPWMVLHRPEGVRVIARRRTTREDIAEAVRDRLADA